MFITFIFIYIKLLYSCSLFFYVLTNPSFLLQSSMVFIASFFVQINFVLSTNLMRLIAPYFFTQQRVLLLLNNDSDFYCFLFSFTAIFLGDLPRIIATFHVLYANMKTVTNINRTQPPRAPDVTLTRPDT